jgi:hypothetical protein
VKSGIVVSANSTVRADVQLSVGAVNETVTVSATGEVLQTDRAEVRQSVDRDQLENLPNSIGRNYQSLFVTLPGFDNIRSSYNSTPSNPSKALVFNVNGVSFNINNTKIDGAQSINVWLPHESAYVPTLEAVETVNVVTNSFEAETGLAGGAAVYVQTKSGTNSLHGAAFEDHDNQHLNARPFFLPYSQSKPKFVYNDFGGAVGGPIRRNKLFFFTSYESTTTARRLPHRHRPHCRHQERQHAGLGESDLRSQYGRLQRSRPHSVSQPDRSGCPHRSDRGEIGGHDAAAQSVRQSPEFELLRDRSLHLRPPAAGRQSQLECQQPVQHIRAFRISELQHGKPADFRPGRRHPGGQPGRQHRPWIRSHLQRHGRRHLYGESDVRHRRLRGMDPARNQH